MARKNLILPKRIGGVKLPKKMRRIGNSVLGHPLGREILAGVLVTAGSAVLNRQTRTGSTARRFMAHPVASTRSAGNAVAGTGAEAAATLGTTAGSLSNLILDAFDGVIGRLSSNERREKDKGRSPDKDGKRKGRKVKARKGRRH